MFPHKGIGGGWLVVQRKKDGIIDFNRGWVDCENEFGNLTGEFWYGLTPLHCLKGQWKMNFWFTINGWYAFYHKR